MIVESCPAVRDVLADRTVIIGLVNNMPDAAIRATERQFRELVSVASGNIRVHFRRFALPGVPREAVGRAYLRENYEDIGELWAGKEIDGLIVTGAEPRASDLRDEPYWPSLTRLMEWAEDHTISTVWSCLAAHAAVFRDGIPRRPLGRKLSGVFECTRVSSHPITAGLPPRWSTPHSRYNEVPEEALVAKGYEILARSPDAGVDLFVARRRSLSLFAVQGHPEYEAGTLMREYRRDVARFLTGERDGYPEMPQGYFSDDVATGFAAFRRRALRNRSADLIQAFPAAGIEDKLDHPWRVPAVRIYANWLRYLLKQKFQNRTASACDPRPRRLTPPAPSASTLDTVVR